MLNLSSLNDAQREAVMHESGALLVLAGPGSGKTYTITQRIFYLLEKEKIPPEQILVITFTKDAALSMQSRFLELSHRTMPVNFGTFHSVFYHIVRTSHILDANQILTEAQKKKLIIPIIKKYISQEELQSNQNNFSEEAGTILSAISYVKNTGMLEETISRLPKQWQSPFLAMMEEYEKARRYLKAIDFDDMVYECRRGLSQNKQLREYWQRRFSHILMDEFQDINPMQYEVIRLLASKSYHLFAVGDDDQSIYGFRGSNPACLKRFVEDYGAKQVCLNINYRSRREIIQASLAVIGENKDRFHKELRASCEKENLMYDATKTVEIKAFEEREEQYQYLVTQLKEMQEQQPQKQIGVLFRTNTYMQGVAARLSREGIPYAMKEKVRSIYEHFIIKDIMAYIRLASGEQSRALFLQVMNKPSRYISREALGINEEMPSYQEVKQYYQQNSPEAFNITQNSFHTNNRKIIQNIEIWEKQMQYLAKLSPFLAVQYIRRVIGYDSYLKEKAGKQTNGQNQWLEWEELLDWLSLDATGYKAVFEWMEAQEAYHQALERGEQKNVKGKGVHATKEVPSISLMTVHASKGLEFDKVYIPDCNEKIFPHGNMPNQDTCEEERRIFYVAMTRAKENLELLYLTGTKQRPRLPSRFLNPLLQNYSSTSSSNSQLSRYSSKASATFSYSSSSSI